MSSLITSFSPHIFWDVDVQSVDLEKNGVFVLQRVLQYGILKDWLLLKSIMGAENIKALAVQLPTLDDVSISFLSNLYKIDKSEFKCYKNRRSKIGFFMK
jgi:hypothetical protein